MSVQVNVTIEPTAGGTYKARVDVGGLVNADSGKPESQVLHTNEYDTPDEARRAGEKLAQGINARHEPPPDPTKT
jgi:hypothetical protein